MTAVFCMDAVRLSTTETVPVSTYDATQKSVQTLGISARMEFARLKFVLVEPFFHQTLPTGNGFHPVVSLGTEKIWQQVSIHNLDPIPRSGNSKHLKDLTDALPFRRWRRPSRGCPTATRKRLARTCSNAPASSSRSPLRLSEMVDDRRCNALTNSGGGGCDDDADHQCTSGRVAPRRLAWVDCGWFSHRGSAVERIWHT